MKKSKAFTLIELIAVLVITAILALIVTPLVLNIIRKARTSADKRSIDAYGRSIELAVADYLLDKGTFPTSIEQLTIEYSGDEVVCNTTKLNTDSSVYLAECKVGGRSVDGYTYGKEETIEFDYRIGDQVTYNNVDYYVIENSDETKDTVTLLKAEPLTVEEVNTYGTGHINRYVMQGQDVAYDSNGYGLILYYSSETCGYVSGNFVKTGCQNDYASSDVKYVVDNWAAAKISSGLQEARLITLAELVNNFNYVEGDPTPSDQGWTKSENTPNWSYGNNYWYWTMSKFDDSTSSVWRVLYGGGITDAAVDYFGGGAIRPVIILSKSSL